MMAGVTDRIADGYRRFAEVDCVDRSPLYGELTAAVADDPEVLERLEGLPVGKRQPNLLLASYRLICGMPSGWEEFHSGLAEHRTEIEAVMLARRTQTNEPARCALQLPLLAALPQPLALLEVGASAGLCLFPDRYGYDYDGHRIGAGPPVLRCSPSGPVPLPSALPQIVWRAGLDLEPIDVFDAEKIRWLELLIWPGEEYRLDTLHGALAVARADPPWIVEGDLTTDDLDALAAQAPQDATLVIFHTAVLMYVSRAGRAAFRERVSRLGATWIACEEPRFVDIDEQRPGMIAIARDGERVAWADGHATQLSWG
jgi:hypothetical protein